MISENELIQRTRSILTERNQSQIHPLQEIRALIPIAVGMLYDRDASKFSEEFKATTAEITVGAGNKVDIATAIDAVGIRLSSVINADVDIVTLTGAGAARPNFNVDWVSTADRLAGNGIQDGLFILAFLDNTVLNLKNGTRNLQGTTFKITAPAIPPIGNLPYSLLPAIAVILAELLTNENGANQTGLSLGANKA